MRFFDTKEEVIDIQLTPYGKHVLSKGMWRPVYYEFYDDDIIYDSSYAGTLNEKQEETSQRIKDTKRVRTQYTFQTPSSGSFLSKEAYIEKRNTLKSTFLPLGNSSIIKNEYPAIQAKMHSAEISEVSTTNNISTIELKDLSFIITNETVENEEDRSLSKMVYDDGSFIDVLEKEILIDITELGVDIEIENFEISFMEIDEQGMEVRKIHFIDEQKPTKVVNDVLVDNEEYNIYSEKLLNNEFENKKFINYFLDVKVDKEIDQSIFCKYLPKEEILRLKIVEGYDIDCVEEEDITTIFSTNATSLNTEEDN